MNHSHLYNQCCKYHGQRVRITGRDGRVHVGEITRVNRQMVWIRPTQGLGGYGMGYYGGYGGYGGWGWGGFGIGFAFGAITTIALAAAFFW
ncbi:hypothetical protein ACFVR1_16025 [Psychrobacillus sp. NPDC058041]|uniref:hypothetical protein n=1 Tax=Psychrobacillus sp. NPDC058041 TaxID=3346310 RepID=UPI0036DEF7E6